MNWSGKVALITGGSSGLGLAIAEAFARAGATVVIAARDAGRLAAAAEQLRRHGGQVADMPADLTDDADAARVVAETVGRFGRLDVLVNNVGRSMRGEAIAVTADEMQSLIETNLLVAVRCTHLSAPHLIAAGGHLVNIGSLAAKSAARWLGAYPASKFALAGYTHQLRLELRPRGVHVLFVCPGPIARADANQRYADQAADLPEAAKKPGGGVRVKGILPDQLAQRIVRACERREAELVVPGKARLLFAIAQLCPSLGDWLVRRWTSDE